MIYLDTERNDLFDPRINIVISLKLESKLPNFKTKLKDKLLVLYSILDITKIKITLDNDKAYYEAIPNSSCEVREVKTHREVMSLIHEPLDIFKGKLMIAFIEENKEEYTLTLLAHHLFGDANSLIIFLDYLFKLMNNEEIKPVPFKVLDSKSLEEKEPLKKYVKYYLRKKNKLNCNLTPLKEKDYFNFYHESNKNDFVISGFKLNTELLQYHKRIAKELGITLNSYFTAVLLKTNPSLSSVGFARSIRKDEIINNQASGLQISYQYKENKPFTYNALKIHMLIKHSLNKNSYFPIVFMTNFKTPLVDYIVANDYLDKTNPKITKISKLCGYHKDNKKQVGITNLTTLSIKEDYADFKITDFIFIPPITSYTALTIGIISDQNGCNIYAHGIASDQNQDLFLNFKDFLETKKFLV